MPFRQLVSRHNLGPLEARAPRRAAFPPRRRLPRRLPLCRRPATLRLYQVLRRLRKNAACTLGLYCCSRLAGGKDAAPVWQSSGSHVRPRPSCARCHGRCGGCASNPSRLCAVAGSIDNAAVAGIPRCPRRHTHTILPVLIVSTGSIGQI